MKSKSIKVNIIISFFISGIQAFFLTFLIFILTFGMMHIFCNTLYINFINLYNTDSRVMIFSLLIMFFIFISLMFFIFMRSMNKITSYIREISKVLNLVAVGHIDAFIPIKRKDELGDLADNVNKMVCNLNELIEKEREWDSQKNNLITNLSHDLRTPLTSILGFLELIEKETNNNEKLKHYCKISLEKAKQLKESIDLLFEFSKLNNAELEVKKSKISIEELIEQVTMGFIPDFEDNNMEYRIISQIKDLMVNVDPILLGRAFENIISNSIKYAKDGKYLDIIIDKQDDEVIVKFINYGEQIKEDEIADLFDKFYRGKKNCDKREGTGLGLAIVKTVMELHSGEISITSTKEKTEFEFKIPFK